jgi:hypothetical protein
VARIPEALARALAVPTNRITGILNGQRGDRRHGAPVGALLRHERRVLAESAKSLRTATGRAENRGSDQGAAEAAKTETHARVRPVKGSLRK